MSPNVKKAYVYSLENDSNKLSGEYKFLEEKIISSRFEDLVIDVKDIELYEDDENDLIYIFNKGYIYVTQAPTVK
jgi:hypothetical protein